VTAIRDFVRGLGLDAYVVGGAVRDELLGLEAKDEDFVVPGVDHAGLRAALAPYGRVEDMEVAKQLVGVRLHPRQPALRRLAPKGIEVTPPRAERSTGPGHQDFEIVVDPSITLEEDMARRDFTINAMAKRLEDGALLDPFDGERDLEAGVLRTVSPQSFREDPLRLVRGLRFVSQLGLEPDETTLAQMRAEAEGLRHVSGERIGGGIAADGMGELSKLLLGTRPAKALRLARDTGVLVELLPELARSIGFEQESRWHEYPLDEHLFEVVQATADADDRLPVRLAALLHDSGKPASAWRGDDGRLHFYAKAEIGNRSHEDIGADLAGEALARLRYPTRLRSHVRKLVRAHMFHPPGADRVKARRFLHRHGAELAFDLVALKRADLLGKGQVRENEIAGLEEFRETLEQERTSPYRLADLAIDGTDLIALGFEPGPELGRTLEALIRDVVVDPERNQRDWLLHRAREELKRA
jgi:tRNA nucleotidyltransferase (CCA-adding enzyme)